jgi:NAD(P)-dependent dehydrogenase (short-subunit alcohol dehydrogenase family)
VEAWQQVIDVNLNGLFHCCRGIVPLMREAGYGRIVNIASVAGKDGNPNASAYSASKAAVIALTKSLGKELADTGVRVNCVTPAAVKTAIFEQMSNSTSSSCSRRFPWAASARLMRSPPWWSGCAPRSARFPPAPRSIFRAAAPLTDDLLIFNRQETS